MNETIYNNEQNMRPNWSVLIMLMSAWALNLEVKAATQPLLDRSRAAIEAAGQTPGCSGGDLCNFFVAVIGEIRQVPYFRDVFYPGKKQNTIGGDDEGRKANDIYDFICRAVNSSGSGWQSVAPQAAQTLANSGRFVIGVARNLDRAKSGHITIVAPDQMPKVEKQNRGDGPWVRDSQSPHISVRAGVVRFVSPHLVLPPIWAVWNGPIDIRDQTPPAPPTGLQVVKVTCLPKSPRGLRITP